MMMAPPPSPQRQNILEADIRLRSVVYTVWDGYHRNGGHRGATGPVTTAHQGACWEVRYNDKRLNER